MATTTTTTTMPGLTSSFNSNVPSALTLSTNAMQPQTVQVLPATPIRGDGLGVPVAAPTGIAITPQSNVQWNSITLGLASISMGPSSLAPGQSSSVNLPAPLFSTAAQTTATPSRQLLQGSTFLLSASSYLPNTTSLNLLAGITFNLKPTTTSAIGSVGAPRIIGGPGLSPANPTPANTQAQAPGANPSLPSQQPPPHHESYTHLSSCQYSSVHSSH